MRFSDLFMMMEPLGLDKLDEQQKERLVKLLVEKKESAREKEGTKK